MGSVLIGAGGGTSDSGVTPYLGFVTAGNQLINTYSAGNKFLNFRARRVAKTRIRSPRLILANTYMSGSNEVGTGATASVTASIEYNGTLTQAKFSGATTGTVANNGILVSDPLDGVDIPAGALFFVRGWGSYPGGMPYVGIGATATRNVNGGECFEYSATTLTDRTMTTGTFTSNDAGGPNMMGPLGIIAMTTQPSLFWLGDSTFSGVADDFSDDSGDWGLTRTLAQFYAGFNAGVGSATAAGFIASSRTNRMALSAYCSHLIQGHTLNMTGNTLASMQADLTSERALFPALRALMTTTPPQGATTDAGATVANQTPGANESKRVALNTWKRSVPDGWQGCIEIADLFEVNANGAQLRAGGRYPPLMSADMLHPTPWGYQFARQRAAHLRTLSL